MSLSLVDVAPVPLPAPPCPVYGGRVVEWSAWKPTPVTTHVDPRCSECRALGGLSCWGMTQPLPGETNEVPDMRMLPSGRQYQRGVRQAPAYPVRALWAQLCPSCGHLTVLPMDGDEPATLLLCDGCDVVCAVGADDAEARATLERLGGWGSEGADWDLCLACLPTASGLRSASTT